jgi:hypothetical protein
MIGQFPKHTRQGIGAMPLKLLIIKHLVSGRGGLLVHIDSKLAIENATRSKLQKRRKRGS